MVGWEEWKKNDKYGEKKISNRSRGKDGERAQEKIGMADMKRKYEIWSDQSEAQKQKEGGRVMKEMQK